MQQAQVVVAAALLRGAGAGVEVLAAQRLSPPALAGMWEFIGGKVEPGEDDLSALRRECAEELSVEIVVGARVGTDVVISDGEQMLRVWTARIVEGDPARSEHGALRWLTVPQLYDVEWLPADLPIVAALQSLLGDDALGQQIGK